MINILLELLYVNINNNASVYKVFINCLYLFTNSDMSRCHKLQPSIETVGVKYEVSGLSDTFKYLIRLIM